MSIEIRSHQRAFFWVKSRKTCYGQSESPPKKIGGRSSYIFTTEKPWYFQWLVVGQPQCASALNSGLFARTFAIKLGLGAAKAFNGNMAMFIGRRDGNVIKVGNTTGKNMKNIGKNMVGHKLYRNP